jgi:hypothetical protein
MGKGVQQRSTFGDVDDDDDDDDALRSCTHAPNQHPLLSKKKQFGRILSGTRGEDFVSPYPPE